MKTLLIAITMLVLTGCVGFTPPATDTYSTQEIKDDYYYSNGEKHYWKDLSIPQDGKSKIEAHTEWCGVTLWVLVPIPLKLPVCESYAEVNFLDGHPATITTKQLKSSKAYLCGPGTWVVDGNGHGKSFCGSFD